MQCVGDILAMKFSELAIKLVELAMNITFREPVNLDAFLASINSLKILDITLFPEVCHFF